MTIKWVRLLIIVWISNLFLTGCTGGIVDPVAGSPTVADAYTAAQHGKTTYDQSDDQANQNENNESSEKNVSPLSLPVISNSDLGNGGNQASFESTLNAQFPTLPNPNCLMYVFGHYAGDDELPVPGHFVPFSLYTRTYYAMPNEVLMPYNDGQFIQTGNE